MARRKRNYTVRTGDTAATIAKQLGIDPQTLMQANTGVGNLRPGMVLKTPSPDYSGLSLAHKGGKVLYSLRPDFPGYYPPATQPIPAYTQPAGRGEPTDYSKAYFGQQPVSTELPAGAQPFSQHITVAYQLSQGYSDEEMESVGFVRRGELWMMPTAVSSSEGATAAGGTGGASKPLGRGEVPGFKDLSSEQQRKVQRFGGFYQERESQAMPGQTYTSYNRYDAYGKLRTYAPAAKPVGRLGYQPPGGGYHKRGSGWSVEWEKRKKKGDDGGSGPAVGRAAPTQQYGGYGTQAGYMPSVKQYARPNYLGLINWRI